MALITGRLIFEYYPAAPTHPKQAGYPISLKILLLTLSLICTYSSLYIKSSCLLSNEVDKRYPLVSQFTFWMFPPFAQSRYPPWQKGLLSPYPNLLKGCAGTFPFGKQLGYREIYLPLFSIFFGTITPSLLGYPPVLQIFEWIYLQSKMQSSSEKPFQRIQIADSARRHPLPYYWGSKAYDQQCHYRPLNKVNAIIPRTVPGGSPKVWLADRDWLIRHGHFRSLYRQTLNCTGPLHRIYAANPGLSTRN